MVARLYIQGQEEQAAFDQLTDSVISQNDTFTSEYENSDGMQTTSKYTEYLSIYKKNNDFVCWINIDGTLVNYPVMYTPDDPQYYLRRAFDKSDSQSGTPFVGEGGISIVIALLYTVIIWTTIACLEPWIVIKKLPFIKKHLHLQLQR